MSLLLLLVLLGLRGISADLNHGNCTDYELQFERVFSVPGDSAVLNSTLVSPDVFDFTSVPYDVTWYESESGREMSNRSGRVLVLGAALWFLDLQLQDAGEYVTVLRTPSRCYRQATKLVVEPPAAGECGRPRKAWQSLTYKVTDALSCPLRDYISTLDSYNVTSHITWYRGCERIVDGEGRYSYFDTTKLKIVGVERSDSVLYTCTLSFTLGGANGSVSETIEAWVSDTYSRTPLIHEPANVVLKAQMGSSFTKRCRVFVPCVGKPNVDVVWIDRHSSFVLNTVPDHIYTSKQRSAPSPPGAPGEPGVWLERLLMFSELREEDFNATYTCLAQSSRRSVTSYFTLLPADPDILLPVGSLLGGVATLFIVSVVLYYVFKVDMVLWFRRAFPVLYTNTDLDGKSYDAYVAYPRACAAGCSQQVAAFALHTLPQVLEKACGYKLFIAGRDCTPGTAVADSVEENMRASRRLLLLYGASTFSSRRDSGSNNNNDDDDDSKSGGDQAGRQQLECVMAMHRALLEGSLKVILVELEKISPAQLALFPESVRHLRKKQGAVRWWRNPSERRRWRSCTAGRTREDEEKGGRDEEKGGRDEEKGGRDEEKGGRDEEKGGPSLCPSSRFWKEVRYRMPVRGKRALYPEKTALLNL